MNFVWITSYLCVFLVGGMTSLVGFYLFIERSINKEERKLVNAAATRSLQETLAPYGVKDPFLN